MNNRNLVFTLGFNLVSEIKDAVERLYLQNDRNDFSHLIVDCQFPLLKGDEIPEDIEDAKKQNSDALKALAWDNGSDYMKIENVGVSQNWTTVYNHLKPDDDDNLITCEPDEIQHEDGWVNAISDTLRLDKILGYVAPMLIDHKQTLKSNRYAQLKKLGHYEIYMMANANINYGQIGISGRLLNKMGGVGVPKQMTVYGGIEGVLLEALKKYGMAWGILKDYTQTHTNVPVLYRKYKDEIIFNINKRGQYSFEKWLEMKKNGEL